MRILVCGAGATGMHVARVLSAVHHVTMIESAPECLPSEEDLSMSCSATLLTLAC